MVGWYSRCSKKGRYDGLMVVLVAYGGGVMELVVV